MVLGLAVVAGIVGLLIGAVGIGGILLIPALMSLNGMSAHTATASALATFIFTGLLGTWLFQRRGSIEWRKTGIVCAAAIAFSVLGALVSAALSATNLTRIIAVLIIFAGSYIFLPKRAAQTDAQRGARREDILLGVVGAAAGFGSGLSGAGGPLFSVPLMMLFGFPPLMAIGTSQVLQIVSAGAATATNLQFGTVDLQTVLWITGFELAGVIIGAKVAHAASADQLRKGAAVLCLVVGTFMLAATF